MYNVNTLYISINEKCSRFWVEFRYSIGIFNIQISFPIRKNILMIISSSENILPEVFNSKFGKLNFSGKYKNSLYLINKLNVVYNMLVEQNQQDSAYFICLFIQANIGTCVIASKRFNSIIGCINIRLTATNQSVKSF